MTILGPNRVSARKLARWYKRHRPSAAPHPELGIGIRRLARIFVSEGKAEGVRGDVAFCQAVKETGWFGFGGDVMPNQHNYAGLGATGGVAGASFPDPRIGVRAQIQHLARYADGRGIEDLAYPLVDPRFELVSVRAERWEDLDGRWAVPGDGYGESILSLYRSARRS